VINYIFCRILFNNYVSYIAKCDQVCVCACAPYICLCFVPSPGILIWMFLCACWLLVPKIPFVNERIIFIISCQSVMLDNRSIMAASYCTILATVLAWMSYYKSTTAPGELSSHYLSMPFQILLAYINIHIHTHPLTDVLYNVYI